MNLSDNLQHLMRINGNISVSELARLTNLPQPTIHHILSGSTKNPRKRALETLSNYFSVSVEQLIGKSPLPNIIPDSVKEDLQLRTVPIVPWNMLKKWPTTRTKELQLKETLLDKEVGENSFALTIEDSSMEPLFPKDALLIFDHTKKPKDRDFVIIHLKQDNSILFNRLFTENNETFIKQNLADGNAILIKIDKMNDRILGTLAEVRIQY